jgi:hypothetical protein
MAPQPPTDSNALPLFYRNPAALDATRHARAGLSGTGNYAFAQATNVIPLTGPEMVRAQAYYPIVFGTGAKPPVLAVVGYRNNENLFIDANGQWRRIAYVPAYVRRYPFIFLSQTDEQRLILCVDEGAPQFQAEGGEHPLFDGDKASQSTEQALKFCAAFQADIDATQAFTGELVERNLLVENRAEAKLDDGRRFELTGFQMVPEERFNLLPDSVIVDWRKRGVLALLYAHLMSQHRWRDLTDLILQKS